MSRGHSILSLGFLDEDAHSLCLTHTRCYVSGDADALLLTVVVDLMKTHVTTNHRLTKM